MVAFDLDSTLAVSKGAITDSMSQLLGKLLDRLPVCVISGGKFEQFEAQLISNLHVSDAELAKLHLMPTCGTRYFLFRDGEWMQVYAEELAAPDRAKIKQVLEAGAKELQLWEAKTWGEIIEDRGTQVTFSALGQEAPIEAKLAWDPDRKKKQALQVYAAKQLPEFEVRIGGKTSVDVTAKGIDKAYGMKKLQEVLGIGPEGILFIGDELGEGGNDYPVKAAGIDCIEVKDPAECETVIQSLLSGS